MRFVEFTTKQDDIKAKIKGDIDSCLDEKKTGVKRSKINKLIIICNQKISPENEQNISDYAESKEIPIELIDLSWLALDIFRYHHFIAKEFLNIPFDTGQIQEISQFINEQKAVGNSIATPLDNPFLYREEELKIVSQSLESSDLIILYGPPGVGKTKLALESLSNFVSKNKSFTAFVISKKDIDIFDDLQIRLEVNKNYILLIDDANRQSVNYAQILGFQKGRNKGKLKILVTVRNYALEDVLRQCATYDKHPHQISIGSFSDEQILDLIKSDSFKILNPKFQRKIVEIADGNCRLAVMAARLANDKQTEFLYGGVYDLFDSYFSTFIGDKEVFTNIAYLKTLGLISFFFTIDRNNKAFTLGLLETFGIHEHEFHETLHDLERKEMIEIFYDHARISEQVMATYFFYKVFIKEEILSFRTLLSKYFPKWKSRFTDSIIPANNSFLYENVLNRINNDLSDYFYSLKSDDEKIEFFSLFWFYKQSETLEFFNERINDYDEPKTPIYAASYETNDFVYDKDDNLKHLKKFFQHLTEYFEPAVTLAFENSRKKPNSLPELIRRIREYISFDPDDSDYGFQKQLKFFQLITNTKNLSKPHYRVAFIELSKSFLKHSFQTTKGGRKNQMVIQTFTLPYNEQIAHIRDIIWNALFGLFHKHEVSVIDVINDYKPEYRGISKEILNHDLKLLLPFLDKNFSNKSFLHVHCVRELIRWVKKETEPERFDYLEQRFNSREYEDFCKIDWNRLRDKEDYEFEDHNQYEQLKHREIESSFKFNSESDFERLGTVIKNFTSINGREWNLNQSLDIVLSTNTNRNYEIGLSLLQFILNNTFKGLNPPYNGLKNLIEASDEYDERIFNELDQWANENRIYWLMTYFGLIPKEHIGQKHLEVLLKMIGDHDRYLYLRFETIEKFEHLAPDVCAQVLSIVVDKIENEKINFNLGYDFFQNFADRIDDFGLLSKAYIQQERIESHFDHDRKDLQKLVSINNEFIKEYILSVYCNQSIPDTHNDLSFLWEVENGESIIYDCIRLISDNHLYFGILDHPITIFFKNYESDKYRDFILKLIRENYKDIKMMNAIIDVVRNKMSDLMEEVILFYLTLTNDKEIFGDIEWVRTGGVHSGHVNFSEIRANGWRGILETVNKADDQLSVMSIKTMLKRRIEHYERSAESERLRKFINPSGF